MSEITFEMLMADLFLLACGMLTIPTTALLIELTDWKYNPTIRNAVILFIGIQIPLWVGAFIVHFWMGIPCIPFL